MTRLFLIYALFNHNQHRLYFHFLLSLNNFSMDRGINFILWNCFTFIHSEIVLRIARIISKQRRINNIIRSQFMPSVAGNMNLVSNFKRNLFSMQGFQRNLYALCTPIHFVNVPPDTICLSEYAFEVYIFIFSMSLKNVLCFIKNSLHKLRG